MYYLSKALVFIACLVFMAVAFIHPAAPTQLKVLSISVFLMQAIFVRRKNPKAMIASRAAPLRPIAQERS